MLVHPNPMVDYKHGVWEDAKLSRVMVKPFLVSRGSHRQRWGVYERSRRGGALTLVSQHITEAQAVVSAQRLANRLFKQASTHVIRAAIKSKQQENRTWVH